MYHYICKYCGKPFDDNHKNRKFCCNVCKAKYFHENLSESEKKELKHKQSIGLKRYINSLSEEEKLERINRSAEGWRVWVNNLTEEERLAKNEKIKHGMENMSEEDKKLRGENWSKSFLAKSKEELEAYGKSQSEKLKKVYSEHGDEIIAKRTDTISKKPKEEITNSRNKQTETIRNSYGYDIVVKKRFETMKNNYSYKKSNSEDLTYELLVKLYGEDNVIRQYIDSVVYPYHCDFYIKSEDLFIECNYHWTHGGMPFNENDQACLDLLEEWCEKAQNSKYTDNAIITWTQRDVEKRSTAKSNNLNYIEFFSLEEAMLYYENFTQHEIIS